MENGLPPPLPTAPPPARKTPSLGTLFAITFLVLVFVIAVLYFWGEAVIRRPA